jgi:hypothetical protein
MYGFLFAVLRPREMIAQGCEGWLRPREMIAQGATMQCAQSFSKCGMVSHVWSHCAIILCMWRQPLRNPMLATSQLVVAAFEENAASARSVGQSALYDQAQQCADKRLLH